MILQLVDIDDDNDGIRDSDEALNCFFTTEELNYFEGNRDTLLTITSDLTFQVGNTALLSNGVYGNQVLPTNSQTLLNKTILEITPTKSIEVDTIIITMNNATQTFFNTGAVVKVQGFNGVNWIDLSPTLQYNTTSGTATTITGATGEINFPISQNQGRYLSYRIFGQAGSIRNSYYLQDVHLNMANFRPEDFPKTSCDADKDGDGIYNHLDLDSDGDGCYDITEAGAGFIGDSLVTQNADYSSVGNNGLADNLELSADTSLINYSLFNYFLDNVLNACLDTDMDSVGDLVDIDDDNDGILDTDEILCTTNLSIQNGVATGTANSRVVTAEFANGAIIANYQFSTNTDHGTFFTNFTDGFHYSTFDGSAPFSVADTHLLSLPNNGILEGTIEWGPEVPTNSSSWAGQNTAVHDITLTWTPNIPAIVTNPSGQISLVDGAVINSGITFTQNAGTINSRNWKIEFQTKGITQNFQLMVAHEKVSAINYMGYGFNINGGLCQILDTDADGTPNYLDLDSDGDGCYDAKEAGVTGATNNGSITDSLIATTSAQVGLNGLANSVETNDTDSALITYLPTYYIATSDILNACADSDMDGIGDLVDIDDDNDGTPDVAEYNCEAVTFSNGVASGAANARVVTGIFSNNLDTANYRFTSDANNGTFYTNFTDGFHYSTYDNVAPHVVNETHEITINVGTFVEGIMEWGPQVPTNSSTWANQNVNLHDITLTWSPLVKAIMIDPNNQTNINNNAELSSGDTFTPVTGTTNTRTWKIQFQTEGQFTDFNLQVKHERSTGLIGYHGYGFNMTGLCKTKDTDMDGIPNHLDLDSDADGCSDAYEAGAVNRITDSLVIPVGSTLVGINGLADAIETTADNGRINYPSNYDRYATVDFLNACADTDMDGINDLVDIDDDNDGIRDSEEAPDCFYPMDSVNFYIGDRREMMTVSSDLTFQNGNPSLLVDGTYGNQNRFTNGQPLLNEVVVEIIPNQPVEADAIIITMNNAAQTFFNNGAVIKVQGYDGVDWLDLSGTLPYNTNSGTATTITGATGQVRFPVNNDQGVYRGYRILGQAGTVRNTYYMQDVHLNMVNFKPEHYPRTSCNADTDGDGIYNHLDLDSDGDGCFDAVEAGSVMNTTDSLVIPLGSTAVGSNGLADIIETDIDSDTVTYESTYNAFAIVDFLNACADFDNDGIGDLIDIDDDNDGIRDSQEAPDCFKSITDFQSGNRSEFVSISTEFNMNPTYNQPNELVDGDNGTAAVSYAVNMVNSQALANKTVYQFDFVTKVNIKTIYLQYVNGNSHFINGARTILQGSNDGTNWLDLNVSTVYNQANLNTAVLDIGTIRNHQFTTTQNVSAYKHYRIFGVSGTIWSGGFSNEVYFEYNRDNTFRAENFPLTSCNADTDGDGTYNHLDLDSDGDGCFDAVEAGAVNNTTDSLVIPIGSTAVGSNGLADHLETSTDSDSINYESTYDLFALASHLDVCADTDNDGIGDLIDIDDDNDGILDIQEQSSDCSFVGATDLTTLTFNNVAVGIDQFTDSLSIRRISGSWSSSYSNQLFERPLTFEFAISNVSSTTMIGLIGDSRNQTLTNWNDQSHKFYFSSATAYDIRDFGAASNGSTYSNGDVFQLTIDAAGNLVMRQNGNAVYTDVTTDTNFRLAFSTASATAKPLYKVVVGNTDEMLFTCMDIDTDGDGTPDRLDLDSDGDGCYDISEAGAGFIGDSLVTQNGNYVSVGANGFANNLETASDNDTISYTLQPFYQDSTLNACEDHDGDLVGDLVDIDDDNDGILDTDEVICGEQLSIQNGVASGTANARRVDAQFANGTDTLFYQFSTNTDNGTFYTNFTNGFHYSTYDGSAPFQIRDTHSLSLPSNHIYNGTLEWGPEVPTNSSSWAGQNTVAHDITLTWTPNVPAIVTNPSGQTTLVDGATINSGITFTQNAGTINSRDWKITFQTEGTATAFELMVEHNHTALIGYHGYGFNINGGICNILDTDMDGIVNSLDLDSDGDGCFDAYESGVTGATNDGSTTDSLIATNNVQVGLNGLANSIETNDRDTATTTYNSTYTTLALADFLNACADSDMDGINDLVDIDDDNDGIRDSQEAPDCFYDNAADAVQIIAVTSELNIEAVSRPFSNAFDGIVTTASYTGFAPNQNHVDKTIYEITLSAPIALSSIDFRMYNLAFTNGAANTNKLQGWTGSVWEDLDMAANRTVVNNRQTFTNSLHPDTKYNKYRVVGVAGVTYYARVYEIEMNYTGFRPEDFPKLTCNADTDGDGIYNHLDLDSDGDGCFDAVEAGAVNNTTDSLVIPAGSTLVGTNGLADIIETNADSDSINYESTYDIFAVASHLDVCADSDNDGIGDLVDIDDDNDGILDYAEQSDSCYFIGGQAIDQLSFTGNGNELLTLTENSIFADATTTAWRTSFSDQTLALPIHLEFKIEDVAQAVMFGLFPTTASPVTTNWNYTGYKHYIPNTSSHDVRVTGSTFASATYVAGTLYAIDIDEAGNVSYKRDGEEVYTTTGAPLTTYKLAVSTATTTGRTFTEIVYANADDLLYVCTDIDTDGDGTPDRLDLDSDGDGCFDISEAGAGFIGDSLVTQNADYVSVGANGLANNLETATDNDTINYTLQPFYQDSAKDACEDNDGDLVGDLIDIDDDNDGVLDAAERMDSCYYTGGHPVNNLTFTGSTVITLTQDATSVDANSNTTSWQSTYSDQVFSLPIKLQFKAEDIAQNIMVGLFPTTATPVNANWNYIGYKHYLNTSSTNQVRVDGSGVLASATYEPDVTFEIFIDELGEVSFLRNGQTVHTIANAPITSYKLAISTATNVGRRIENLVINNSNNISFVCKELDTDMDGIPNHLDLDSDGDGCYDAYESAVTGATNDGSQTDSLIATTSAQVGLNGLANSIESGDSITTTTTYISTYNNYATVDFLNACADTDMDGIGDLVDIDDDNDGIRDSHEAPNCFFQERDFQSGNRSSFISVSTDLNMNVTYSHPEELVDSFNSTAATDYAVNMINSQALADKTVFQFDFALPVNLQTIYLQYVNANSHFINGAVAKLQGSNDGVNWIDLNTGTTYNQANLNTPVLEIGTIRNHQFAVTQNAAAYKNYRIYGVSGTIWSGGFSNEVYFEYNEFRPEDFPKTSCTADTDDDGIYNHLDLDSDGDGCYDVIESGAVSNLIDSLVIPAGSTAVGMNGLADIIETSIDSDTINFNSTYNKYAIVDFLNACADTDMDGILDIVDIDDDNDGIRDSEEAPDCFTQPEEINYLDGDRSSTITVTSDLTFQNGNTDLLADGVYGNQNRFTNGQSIFNVSILEIDPDLQLELDEIIVTMNNATQTFFNNGSVVKVQGYDGVNWIDISPLMAYGTTDGTPTTIQGATGQIAFPISINQAPYDKYRIFGQGGTVRNTYYLQDIHLSVVNFRSEDFPKMACNADTDDDGIYNHLDLDSDNDGCYDIAEAGGGAVGDSLVTQSPSYIDVSDNGLADHLETSTDSDQINYTSKYYQALTNLLNACADTDNDGIGDLNDIDDDNDGILDEVELACADATFENGTNFNFVNLAQTGAGQFVSGDFVANYSLEMDAQLGTTTYYKVDSTDGFHFTIYDNDGGYVEKHTLSPQGDAVLKRVLYGPQVPKNNAVNNGQSNTAHTMKVSWTPAINAIIHIGTPAQITSHSDGDAISSGVEILNANYVINAGDWHIEFLADNLPLDFELTIEHTGTGMTYEGYGINASLCGAVDTDMDGTPNSLDLDSDNDGCYDAWESGVTGTTNNGSLTDSLIATTNAQVGLNGLANSIETNDSDTAMVTYISTYNNYATVDFLNACADTDNDGINDLVDIDDDNDGIRDSQEAPDCFFEKREFQSGDRSAFVTVSTGLNTIITYNDPPELVDGDNGVAAANYAVQLVNSQSLIDQTVYQFDFALPVNLSTIYIQYVNGNSHFINGAIVKLQGSNDGNTWMDLNDGDTYNQANLNTQVLDIGVIRNHVFAVTKNGDLYRNYRIQGVSGTSWSSGLSNEAYFETTDFLPEYYPKTTCNMDSDGDGIYNHLDLDSDNDGCFDIVEAGAGFIGDSLVTQNSNYSTVGTNGLADHLETTADNHTINYTSKYYQAITPLLNACADSDMDGIGDLNDIDDDNDGILDDTELACGSALFGNGSNFAFINEAQTARGVFDNGQFSANYSLSMDAQLGTTTYFKVDSTDGFHFTIYDNDGGYNENHLLLPQGASVLNRVFYGPQVSTNAAVNNGQSNTAQTMQLTWTPAINAVLHIGTAAQIISHSDGDLLSSGVTLTTSTYVINQGDWYIEFLTDKLPISFELNVTHTGTSMTYEGYGINAEVCGAADTDGDGIPNSLDLDSDGDGCYDISEAGAGFIGDSLVTQNPNYVSVGLNGFADNLETATDSDSIAYSYQPYAYDELADACFDSDNDGVGDLIDIDDDNDGVLDTQEDTEVCNFTTGGNFFFDEQIENGNVGWILCSGSPDPPANTLWGSSVQPFDGDFQVGFHEPEIFTLQLPTPMVAGQDFVFSVATAVGSITPWSSNFPAYMRVYASNATCTQTQLLGRTTTRPNQAAGWLLEDLIFTPNDNYQYLTLVAESDQANGWQPGSTGYLQVDYINFQPLNVNNINPCDTMFINDYDRDGIINSLDLDSDGDGCSDASEAGSLASTTDSLVTGPYGLNGLANSLESNDTDTADINYSSTYYIALSDVLNTCQDFDGDGIGDLIDIDDDNDGIPDETELSCGNGIAETTTFTLPIGTQLIEGVYQNDSAKANYSIDLSDASVALVAANNYDGNGLHYIFNDATTNFTSILTISPQTNTLLSQIKWGPNLNNNADTENINIAQTITLTWTPNVNATVIDPDNQLDIANGTIISSRQVLVQAATYTAAAKPTWYIQFNTNLLNTDFVLTTNHVSASNMGSEGYDLNASICYLENTDEDGFPNHLDLDSDNDGCSDLAEAGAGLVTDSLVTQSTNYVSVGLNGLADYLETTDLSSADVTYNSTYYLATSPLLNACADFDGDGIGDLIDIDDDNDGVPDDIELDCAPSVARIESTVTTAQAQNIQGVFVTENDSATINIDFIDVENTTLQTMDIDGIHYIIFDNTDGNFTIEHTVTPQDDALINEVLWGPNVPTNSNAQRAQNNEIQDMVLTWSPNVTAIIHDEVGQLKNVVDGDIITSGTTIATCTAIPIMDALWYIEFRANKLDAPFVLTTEHITISGNHTYEGYGINVELCGVDDLDGDGQPNHLDLDADGDGCPDAVESGATVVKTDSIFTGNVGLNGLDNSLEIAVDTGIINYNLRRTLNDSLDFLSASINVCNLEVNCADGLDDDGDGLIDLNDPDCICNSADLFDTQPVSFFPNPSFEDRTCCPSSFSQLNCAVTWAQATGATSDYLNTCNFFGHAGGIGVVPTPFPDGEGAVGTIKLAGTTYSEYVGACFPEPLTTGTSYTLDFWASAAGTEDVFGGDTKGDIVILGIPNCVSFPIAGTDSKEDDYTVLGRVPVDLQGGGAYKKYRIAFTVDQNYFTILIGSGNNMSIQAGEQGNYVVYDDLTLNETEAYVANITQAGGTICEGDLKLLSPPTNEANGPYSYQWFKNGIAIPGATDTTYTVDAIEHGEYVIQVMAANGCELSNILTVERCEFDPPFIIPNPLTIPQDSTGEVCMPVFDPNEGDTLTAMLCGMEHGSATQTLMNGQLCIEYTPDTGFSGTDSICVIVCDQTNRCDTTFVPVTVIAPLIPTTTPVPPIVIPTQITIPQDSSGSICTPILDPNPNEVFTANLCIGSPANGSATPTIDGNSLCVSYQPNSGYTGVDPICIIVCDKDGLCDTVDITVNVIPIPAPYDSIQAPIIVLPPMVTNMDSTATNCGPIIDVNFLDTHTVTICELPMNGQVFPVVDNDTKTLCLTYDPNPGFTGMDSVCLVLCDQTNLCDTVKVPIIVLPTESVNNPPVVIPNPLTVLQDSTGDICVPILDPDAGDMFTYTPCGVNNGTATGTVNNNQLCLAYTPDPGFTGRDSICVIVCDQVGACDTTAIPVTVLAPLIPQITPEPPIVIPQVITVPQDSTGMVCSIILDENLNDTFNVNLCVGSPENGMATPTIIGDQICIEYTPNSGYSGSDGVCVIVCDSSGLCDTVTFPVAVIPTPAPPDSLQAPIVVIPAIVTPEDSITTVCGPVVDANMGDTHTVSICGQAEYGTATVSIDNVNHQVCVTYDPIPLYEGPDSVCVEVCDQTGLCDTVIVPIVVVPRAVRLALKVMLQGALINPLNPGLSNADGMMRDDLRQNNHIPLTQPYHGVMNAHSRFNHYDSGAEWTTQTVLDANAGTEDAIVDWVFIEIRDSADHSNILRTIPALVQRDADIVAANDGGDLWITGLPKAFYISIKHRNHLGAMTAEPMVVHSNFCEADFTTMGLAEFFTHSGYENLAVTTVGGRRALYAGNANTDGKVKYDGGSNDQLVILSEVILHPGNTTNIFNFGNADGYHRGDINMDGIVKYDGARNDRFVTQFIVFFYPLNDTKLNNFNNMIEQMP